RAREECTSGSALFRPIPSPLSFIALPPAALVRAVLRRTLTGKSPFAPARGHLPHRLLDMGHSHVRAVLLMYLWAGIVAFAAVSLSVFDTPAIVLTVTALVTVCALGLIALPRLQRRGMLPWGGRKAPAGSKYYDSPTDI